MRFTPIPTGKFNDSWFVETEHGEFVLRVAPPHDDVFCFYERDMMRQEPGIHSLLRENTSVPVARIVAYDDSHEIVERDFILMAGLPGIPLTRASRVDEAKVLRQVGENLRQAHEITADQYGYLGEHRPMSPQETWGEAFCVMWNQLIDDVVDVGHYDERVSGSLRELLEEHRALFDQEVASRLLHMDVWAQNILVDEQSTVTGLVDWDRALWGDPEIEFAVLDYCGISKQPFWEGYGQERDQSRAAEIRRVFYLLYELQKYIVIREGRNNDSAGARRYKNQVLQIARQQLGVEIRPL